MGLHKLHGLWKPMCGMNGTSGDHRTVRREVFYFLHRTNIDFKTACGQSSPNRFGNTNSRTGAACISDQDFLWHDPLLNAMLRMPDGQRILARELKCTG